MTQTKQLQNSDAAHHIHPFTDAKALNRAGTRIISKADGVWIWDSEGNKILDAMAGLWCVNIGYGRQSMADVAKAQIEKLSYYNLFFQSTHPQATELAQLLDSVTPAHMHYSFFCSSGSEANDSNVRFVRHYWATLGYAEKNIIISRKNAYHGSTVAAASLGGMKDMHAQGGLPIENVVHIDEPYWYKNGGDETAEAFGERIALQLEEKILALGEDRVAAFIAEPIQGAGGVVIPPSTYWPTIKKILDKYNILFIADEVICGFGRTGHWFASDAYDLKPDLMTIAKGLSSGYAPIGGVVLSDKVADVLINKAGVLEHGYTYSGHPLCAAMAIENIKIIKQEKIVEQVKNISAPYLEKRWPEFNQYAIVGQTRTMGLLAAIELTANKKTRQAFDESLKVGKQCVAICGQHGLVMRAVGDTMIISPPLVISTQEIDILIEKVHLVLRQLEKTLLKK